MRKNQKYTKEDMYLAIGEWQKSGLSQNTYCNQEGLSRNTFKYWLNKYRIEKGANMPLPKLFIPVEVSSSNDIGLSPVETKNITITYPV